MKQKKKQTKVELTDKAFAQEFVTGKKSGKPFSALRAYKAISPTVTEQSAGELGSRKLKKVEVVAEVIELMKELGFDRKERLKILQRNAKQSISYSASNQAIDVAEKIESGYYSKEKGININFNLGNILDRLDE